MIKYLLDTNILIYTIKNKPEKVRKLFNLHVGQMAISTISIGELIYGAERSTKPEQNIMVIEGLIARLEVLDFDSKAAQHFGEIRSDLYSIGKPIGPYDMMLAGHARSQGLIMVTNNQKEFIRVQGLMLANWA